MARTCVIQCNLKTSRLERTAFPLKRAGCSVQAEYAVPSRTLTENADDYFDRYSYSSDSEYSDFTDSGYYVESDSSWDSDSDWDSDSSWDSGSDWDSSYDDWGSDW